MQSQRGATAFVIYPFNRYTRAEFFGGYMHLSETLQRPAPAGTVACSIRSTSTGNPIFRNGHMLPFGVSLVRETTVFREFGPVAGNTFKVTFSGSPGLSSDWLSRRTLDVDLRHYQRLVANGVLALRFKGFQSWGRNPDFLYFGGNSEMRGYDYLQFLGHKAFFANAELRFPLIEAMLTPVGVLGGLRGVMFFNIGGGGFNGQPFNRSTFGTMASQPLLGLRRHSGQLVPSSARRSGRRLPAGGRARVVRHRPAERAPGLPDALRLVVEDAVQPRLGGRALLLPGHAARPERLHDAAATCSAR